MESNYTKQEWKDYDESKDFQTNVGEGGVATAEKMDHIEQGIYDANIPYTVGSVTTGAEASVVINPDKSIDFVIPSNGSTEKSFGVSTSAPIEGIISKDTVVGENPGFILGPDGTVYEVKGTDVDGNYIVEASHSIQIKGEKGDPGEQGPQGEKGETGEQGPAGQDGATGQSAYELWKAQPGNEDKTETDFLASLKGEKGDKGDPGEGGSDMGNYIGEAPSHPKSMSAEVTDNSTSKPVINVNFSPGATNSGCNYGGMAMLVKEGSVPESFDDAEIVAEVLEGTNTLSWPVSPKTPVEEETTMHFGVSIAPFSTNKAYNKLMKFSELVDVDIVPIRNVWKSYSIGASASETASICSSSFYPGCIIKQPDGFYYGFNGENKLAKMNADTFETTAIDDTTEWSFNTLNEFANTYIPEHFPEKAHSNLSGGADGGAYYVKGNYMYILGDLLGRTSDSSPATAILCIIKIDITTGSYEVFTSDDLNTHDEPGWVGSNGLRYMALPFAQGDDVFFLTRYYVDDAGDPSPFEYAVFKCGADNRLEKIEDYTLQEGIITNGFGSILLMNETEETVKYHITTGKNVSILTLDKNAKSVTMISDVVTASKIASADGDITLRDSEIKSIDGIDPSERYYFITCSTSANYYICYDSEKNSIYKIQGDISNSYGDKFMYIGCGENKLYATTYPDSYNTIDRIELRFEEE